MDRKERKKKKRLHAGAERILLTSPLEKRGIGWFCWEARNFLCDAGKKQLGQEEGGGFNHLQDRRGDPGAQLLLHREEEKW